MPGAHWSGLEQQTSEGVIAVDVPLEAIVRKTFEKTKTICLHTYGCAPELVLTGPECKAFAYVPSHIQYMLLELFKNAVRATVENQRRRHGDQIGIEIPPIEVSLYRGQNDVTIKVRDKGGGIPRRMHDRVFDYAYTTIKKEPTSYDSASDGGSNWNMEDIGARPIAGEGFGLPLVRIYSKYFGGNLSFQSLEGQSDNSVTPFLPRICPRTLLGCFAPPPLERAAKQPTNDLSVVLRRGCPPQKKTANVSK